MVQIDIPAAFVASMLFIDLGRKTLKADSSTEERRKPAIYYRYLYRAVFFAGFVIAPAGIYLLAGWPGWEQIYWSRRFEEVMHTGWLNPLLPAGFVMAIVLAGYLGHVLGYRWLMAGKERLLRWTYIGVLVAVGIVVLCNYPSFLLVGTYDQYHNLNGQSRDEMASVWSNAYGFSAAWVGVMCYFVAGLAVAVWRIRRDSAEAAGK
ncbi:MAG: hypothetical protein AB1714_00755 [Acidobacteriota bacterium]